MRSWKAFVRNTQTYSDALRSAIKTIKYKTKI